MPTGAGPAAMPAPATAPAVRDLVYQALRCRRSFGLAGGSDSGRGLILGGLRLAGADPAELFTGEGHAPPPVTEAETGPAAGRGAARRPARPAGLAAARSRRGAGGRGRAGGRTASPSRADLAAGEPWPHRHRRSRGGAGRRSHRHPTASRHQVRAASHGKRKKDQELVAYAQGLVELQDASSQAVVLALGELAGRRCSTIAPAPAARRCSLPTWVPGSPPMTPIRGGCATSVPAPPAPERRSPPPPPRRCPAALAAGAARRALFRLGHLAPRPEGKWPLTRGAARRTHRHPGCDPRRRGAAGRPRRPPRLGHLLDAARREPDARRCLPVPQSRLAAALGPRFLPGPLGDGFSVAIMGR